MKILVVSLPKSGTYLMGNVLQCIGFENTFKHLSKSGGQEYDPKNIQDGAKNPRKYDSKKSFQQNVDEIKSGQYALSHLGYEENIAKSLEDFFIIYLERDEAEIDESFKRWCEKTERPHKPWKKEKIESIKKWKSYANFSLEFNDMINLNETKLNELQLKLFGCVKFNSKTALENAIQMDSMTKVK